jgi:hypothetical protein
MARTKLIRDLGPLPHRSVLGGGDHKTGRLRQILRSLAAKNQREQPRIFYSLREVARRFRVPVSAVSRVYHDMEEEGLLSRVRASKTILNGLRYNRRRVRAFIGLPIFLPAFVTIPECRAFVHSLQRELWLRGFATSLAFYRAEESDETLSEQFRTDEVDAVVWLFPGRRAHETLLRLADKGIRVAIISQVGTPTMPSSRYYIWKERAIGTLLREWKGNALRKITVLDCKDYRSPVTEEILRIYLETLGFEPTIRTLKSESTHSFLHALGPLKTHGIIIPSAGLASMFSYQSPDGLADLLQVQRVAFIDGPIDMPFANVPDTPADLVAVDWKAVAESIVNDLVTLEAFDRNRSTTFEAQARLRVPLSSFCESFRPSRSMGSP